MIICSFWTELVDRFKVQLQFWLLIGLFSLGLFRFSFLFLYIKAIFIFFHCFYIVSCKHSQTLNSEHFQGIVLVAQCVIEVMLIVYWLRLLFLFGFPDTTFPGTHRYTRIFFVDSGISISSNATAKIIKI